MGGSDWQLLGVVETIFGSLCAMAWVFSLPFQSFVLSHLVFAPVRMIAVGIIINFCESAHLPLSPKLTLTFTSHLGQNVGLGEK